MSLLKQLKEEITKKETLDSMKRRSKVVLEQEWFKDQIEKGNGCLKCSRKENLTIDHLVPESLLKCFGVDIEHCYMEENLRILCKLCNVFKGNQLDFSTPKTKEILLKLLEKI